jgi:hypothetical protein
MSHPRNRWSAKLIVISLLLFISSFMVPWTKDFKGAYTADWTMRQYFPVAVQLLHGPDEILCGWALIINPLIYIVTALCWSHRRFDCQSRLGFVGFILNLFVLNMIIDKITLYSGFWLWQASFFCTASSGVIARHHGRPSDEDDELAYNPLS